MNTTFACQILKIAYESAYDHNKTFFTIGDEQVDVIDKVEERVTIKLT